MLYFKHIAQFYNKHCTNLKKHLTILSKYIPYGKISQINKKGQQVRPQVRPMLYFKHIAQFYNKHSTNLKITSHIFKQIHSI